MKITLLEVVNFKKVKHIKIEPGGRSMVLVGGRNRQGKSSLLGAMSAALGGGKAAPEEPVRKGEKRADIFIELDDGAMTVHRRFQASGKSTLEVRSKDGALRSPQKILDRIVGTRFLDPLKFARLDEKRQREVLLGCVDIGLDLDEHAEERKQAYDNRTDANRAVKRFKTELAAASDPGEVPEQVSPDKLLQDLEDLTDRDAARVDAVHKLDEMRAEAARLKDAIEVTEQRVAAVKREAAATNTRQEAEQSTLLNRHEAERAAGDAARTLATRHAEEAQAAYNEHVEQGKAQAEKAEKLAELDLTEEIETARSKIREAAKQTEEIALMADEKRRHNSAKLELSAAKQHAEECDDKVKALDTTKAEALAAANMPIDGLDIDENRVLYRDVPLSQASGAEQLQVSLAIAAALSPELGDIWLEDGALLDSDSLDLVHQFAKDNDLRVWLERVGESDDDCVIIEEGEVKAT